MALLDVRIILGIGLAYCIQSENYTILIGTAAFMLVFLVHLISNQENMLYVPDPWGNMKTPDENPKGFKNPKELNMEYEEVFVETADGLKIHGWWIPAKKQATGTLLFCHANAGNMGLRNQNYHFLTETCNLNVLAFDYRGFGKSEGKPSEEGLILDGLSMLNYLKEEKKVSQAWIFGRSLGGAVATALAHSVQSFSEDNQKKYPNIHGLILENTFTSIPELALKIFSFLAFLPQYFLDRFMRLKWKTIERLPELDPKVKVLFLVGEKDELVPASQSRALKDAAGSRGRLKGFAEGMHNDTYMKGGAEYWKTINSFIADTKTLTSDTKSFAVIHADGEVVGEEKSEETKKGD